ncbi:hypothetical protein ACJX0J_041458, partial [Zea mays]
MTSGPVIDIWHWQAFDHNLSYKQGNDVIFVVAVGVIPGINLVALRDAKTCHYMELTLFFISFGTALVAAAPFWQAYQPAVNTPQAPQRQTGLAQEEQWAVRDAPEILAPYDVTPEILDMHKSDESGVDKKENPEIRERNLAT